MMNINLDSHSEKQIRNLIAKADGNELPVTSEAGGRDFGTAYLEDDGAVWVRWESGVTAPALFGK